MSVYHDFIWKITRELTLKKRTPENLRYQLSRGYHLSPTKFFCLTSLDIYFLLFNVLIDEPRTFVLVALIVLAH